MFIPLKTSEVFHSRHMEPSGKKFEIYLKDFQLGTLKIPVIPNVHARPYIQADIKNNLIKQITHSVKWTESIKKEAQPLLVNTDESKSVSEKKMLCRLKLALL